MKKWLARPQFHFQSILDVNCKRKMQCLSILECIEANEENCKISGNSGTNGPPCRETHQADTNQSSDILQQEDVFLRLPGRRSASYGKVGGPA